MSKHALVLVLGLGGLASCYSLPDTAINELQDTRAACTNVLDHWDMLPDATKRRAVLTVRRTCEDVLGAAGIDTSTDTGSTGSIGSTGGTSK